MSDPAQHPFGFVTGCFVRRLKRSREIYRAEEWLGKWCPLWERQRGEKFFHCVLYFESGPPMKRIIACKSPPHLADLLDDFNGPHTRWVWQFPEAKHPYMDAPSAFGSA